MRRNLVRIAFIWTVVFTAGLAVYAVTHGAATGLFFLGFPLLGIAVAGFRPHSAAALFFGALVLLLAGLMSFALQVLVPYAVGAVLLLAAIPVSKPARTGT